MSEILANTLEKIFGKNGCMEVIFTNLFKTALIVGIGYLGLKALFKPIDNSSVELSTPVPVLVSETPEGLLSILPTPIATLLPIESTKDQCVSISHETPNAYRAWLKLGKPNTLTFLNESGPDGSPNNKQEITDLEGDGIINDLPRIVHYGDRFCTP